MTLWQLFATQDGFTQFHSAGDSGPVAPSDEEFDAVVASLH